MGRPRKSPDERMLEGNRSRTPIPIDIVVPEGLAFVPEHLQEDAHQCAELILRCFKAKRMTEPDSFALSAFAVAWAWHKHAVHQMNSPDFRPIVKGSRGQESMSPWFTVLNDQARVMLAYATKLYLTPADRAGLAAPVEQPKSKFDGLIAPTKLSPSSNVSLFPAEKGRDRPSG